MQRGPAAFQFEEKKFKKMHRTQDAKWRPLPLGSYSSSQAQELESTAVESIETGDEAGTLPASRLHFPHTAFSALMSFNNTCS